MKMVFLGPPGAGKGTIAVRAKEFFNIPHISTGDLFRSNIKNETQLGLKVKEILASGGLVPDSVTIEMVKNRIAEPDCENGFILDGFPRTIPQAEALAKILPVDAVVNFDIADNEVVGRLSGRRVCKNCGQNFHVEFMPPKVEGKCDKCGGELYTRDDDKIDSIKHRLEVYRSQTAPLIDFYREKNLLTDIDARPATDKILVEFESKFPHK